MATKLEIVGRWIPPKMVNVDELIIDEGDGRDDYQRNQRTHFTRWDWRLYDPIRVSIRSNGSKHVPDGGHRVREARRFGVLRLPALLAESSGAQTEAASFMAFQRSRKALSTLDRYKAALVARELWATTIDHSLGSRGLRIGQTKGWPTIRVVAALKDQPAAAIEFACDMIIKLWHGEGDALTEPILRGLIDFWISKDGEVDAARLETRLKRYTPRAIIQQCNLYANNSPRRFGAYCKTFEEFYNKRK